jgi:flagellum-specific peptidoglycan hydrolase FlgJ
MKIGVGDWCYDPVGPLTDTIRKEFVQFAAASAARAEGRHGVPGPILAAMSIQESGYGRTRLAVLSNNVLSYKRPKDPALSGGRPKFTLWCQPAYDVGRDYIWFGSKDAAFDYVAWSLANRPQYKAASDAYKAAIAAGMDRRVAGEAWLKAIAPTYTADTKYVARVLDLAANPLQAPQPQSSDSLWVAAAPPSAQPHH